MLLGIVGSFIGGFIGYLIFGRRPPARALFRLPGMIGSIVGSIIALLIWRATGGRDRALARR